MASSSNPRVGVGTLASALLRHIAGFLPWIDALAWHWTRKHQPTPPALEPLVAASLAEDLGEARTQWLLAEMRAGRARLFGSRLLQLVLGVHWPRTDIDVLIRKSLDGERLWTQFGQLAASGHGLYDDSLARVYEARVRLEPDAPRWTKVDFVSVPDSTTLFEHQDYVTDLSICRLSYGAGRLRAQYPDDLFARRGRFTNPFRGIWRKLLRLREQWRGLEWMHAWTKRPSYSGVCFCAVVLRVADRCLTRGTKYQQRGFLLDHDHFAHDFHEALDCAAELCRGRRCNRCTEAWWQMAWWHTYYWHCEWIWEPCRRRYRRLLTAADADSEDNYGLDLLAKTHTDEEDEDDEETDEPAVQRMWARKGRRLVRERAVLSLWQPLPDQRLRPARHERTTFAGRKTTKMKRRLARETLLFPL